MTDKACYAGQSEIKGSNGDPKQHSALHPDGIRLDRLGHCRGIGTGSIALRNRDGDFGCGDF